MLKRLLCTVAVVAATLAPALAQIAPNDSGAGIQRGLTAVNSSAQTGFVTVLRGGAGPRLQVTVDGSAGHPESVTLVRGRTCPEALAAPNVAVLGTLRSGRLMASSPIPFDRLMSGNYTVLVRNNSPSSRPVICGHLYLS